MKTLYLLRHGKSSWEQQDLRDFERPLAERGLSDISTMGERFVANGNSVECHHQPCGQGQIDSYPVRQGNRLSRR